MSERDFFDAKTFLLVQFNVTYVHVKLSCVIKMFVRCLISVTDLHVQCTSQLFIEMFVWLVPPM
jgi:hypothetical protein